MEFLSKAIQYPKQLPKQDKVKNINLNTILIAIVLGLSGWNLKETVQQGRDFSRLEERTANLMRESVDHRMRLTSLELGLLQVKVDLARAAK